MNRAFVHLELNTDDIERARAFYQDVLGWDFASVPVAGQKYTQISTPRPPGGGIQVKPHPRMPSHWLPYVGVDDVKKAVERARSAGAEIVADYSAVPGYGALAIITDPTGATFGVWQVVAEDEDKEAPAVKPAAKKPVEAKPAAKKPAAKKTAAKKTAAKKTAAKKPAPKKPAAKKKATKKKTAKAPARRGTKKKTSRTRRR